MNIYMFTFEENIQFVIAETLAVALKKWCDSDDDRCSDEEPDKFEVIARNTEVIM